MYEKVIRVTCIHCESSFDETTVKITDIYSDMEERDVVTFVCPNCGKETESYRR